MRSTYSACIKAYLNAHKLIFVCQHLSFNTTAKLTGGDVLIQNINIKLEDDDIVIAADSGYHTAKALGERVDLLLGDFDSIGSIPRDEGMEIQQVPAEKDYTDTQLAVEIALERGAEDIVIIGGLSGRLDHTLSTLAI